VAFKRRIPIEQLEDRHYEPWEGVNIQEVATVRRRPDEDTLALYLVDVEARASKRFTVTESLAALLKDTKMVAYGSTREDGKKMKVVIQWEREIRR